MRVKITDSAINKIIDLTKGDLSTEGLRIGIRGGGCSGFEYTCRLEKSPQSDDHCIENSGAKIFVDPKSAIFLDGLHIDHKTALMGSGFQFHNPNSTSTCGCGVSFAV